MDKHIHSAHQRIFRDLLRQLRVERGLRQIDVAEAIEEPQSFVSKYESGERRIDILELRAICGALGIRLSDFAERLEASLPQTSRRRGRRRD